MKPWVFLAFESEMRVRYLDSWLSTLEDESENELVATLEGLQVLPRNLWKRPQFDTLRGKQYSGMGEIRFKGDNKQHRVFGFSGPESGRFTLLHACVKQRRHLKGDMDLALERKKKLERGHGRVYEFTIKRRIDIQTTE